MLTSKVAATFYTADPAPYVWNDTVWLFADHDEPGSTTYTMRDWRLFSSTDMANWRDWGAVMSLKTFSWTRADAWAAQAVQRNGKFYLYASMMRTGASGGIVSVPTTQQAFGPSSAEGPWVYQHVRNGTYYNVFASCCPEDIRYSTAPGPTGPWTYRGQVMAAHGGSFTNHPAVIDYKGGSYFFYHNSALPGGGGYTRSIVEKFAYGSDGSIPNMKMTDAGAPHRYGSIYDLAAGPLLEGPLWAILKDSLRVVARTKKAIDSAMNSPWAQITIQLLTSKAAKQPRKWSSMTQEERLEAFSVIARPEVEEDPIPPEQHQEQQPEDSVPATNNSTSGPIVETAMFFTALRFIIFVGNFGILLIHLGDRDRPLTFHGLGKNSGKWEAQKLVEVIEAMKTNVIDPLLSDERFQRWSCLFGAVDLVLDLGFTRSSTDFSDTMIAVVARAVNDLSLAGSLISEIKTHVLVLVPFPPATLANGPPTHRRRLMLTGT
ncbi:glycosyl hydrolase [Lasiosphaeria ovina]|uniref:Glycosyl hydrolase n=1 Tax=Lasiosphaeria ovina TaxID=92902 RepID=A0AAE0K836_9PEZI|nr:glycosyl hydrolase [Lasiosphaeria ovina]